MMLTQTKTVKRLTSSSIWFTLGLNSAFYKTHLKYLKNGTQVSG